MSRVTRDMKRKCVDENNLSFKNILKRQDVKELMELLEPLRSNGVAPAASFEKLKKSIDKLGGSAKPSVAASAPAVLGSP